MERRRLSLRLPKDGAAHAAGMSTVTWNRVEDGKPVRALTYIGVDRVLRWRDGACLEFLANGTEPQSATGPTVPVGVSRDGAPLPSESVGGSSQDAEPDEDSLLYRRPEGLSDQEWEQLKRETRTYIEWQLDRASREH